MYFCIYFLNVKRIERKRIEIYILFVKDKYQLLLGWNNLFSTTLV